MHVNRLNVQVYAYCDTSTQGHRQTQIQKPLFPSLSTCSMVEEVAVASEAGEECWNRVAGLKEER